MEVKYFIVKHKVLKNLLHGQIWSEFEKVVLGKSGELEFFSKWTIKNSTIQTLVTSGKNQNHKSQFSDEFCSVPPPPLACLQEKSNHATSGIF
jgi:hypothetical protein